LLLNIFGEFGLTPAMVGELAKLFSGSTGAAMRTGTHRFLKNRKDLIITPLSENSVKLHTFRNVSQLIKDGIFSVSISDYSKEKKFSKEKNTAYFDADKLRFPLTLRSWKQGDSFIPFGMDGTKKVSDFFTDLKYSIADKEKALVLESNGLIAWIAGERIDNRFRVSEKTKRVIKLKIKDNYQEP
jgi:tRNA(Ile)-lysidine synthase